MKETVNHVCQHTTCKLATSVPQQFCFRLFVLRPLKEEHWTNSWVHVSAANVTNDESTERQCCRQFKRSIFTSCTKNATQKDKRTEDLGIVGWFQEVEIVHYFCETNNQISDKVATERSWIFQKPGRGRLTPVDREMSKVLFGRFNVHIINIRFDLGSFWRDFKFLTETTGYFIVVTEFPHHIHRGCLASVSRADLIDACINRTCVCTCTEKAHTCIYIWTPYPMKHHDR